MEKEKNDFDKGDLLIILSIKGHKHINGIPDNFLDAIDVVYGEYPESGKMSRAAFVLTNLLTKISKSKEELAGYLSNSFLSSSFFITPELDKTEMGIFVNNLRGKIYSKSASSLCFKSVSHLEKSYLLDDSYDYAVHAKKMPA